MLKGGLLVSCVECLRQFHRGVSLRLVVKCSSDSFKDKERALTITDSLLIGSLYCAEVMTHSH